MSLSLIRKGLDLFSEDIKEVGGSAGRGKPKRGAEPGGGMNRTDSKRVGVKKQRQRIHGTAGKRRNRATVKNKTVKSAIEEYRKNQPTSHLEENLAYMLGKTVTAETAVTQRIVLQNRGRRSRDRPAEEKKKPQEKSLFTEADFQNFQKEFFGRRVEGV
ncbi:AROS regulator, partial [Polyodon spathula]|nr:ribosomal protein S19 binding protein 1 [Polyodon spathula]MBN3281064.1 AROS regulator [Polyodon spathula]